MLGMEISYDEETGTATGKNADYEIKITAGSNKAYVNGTSYELDVISNGCVFKPDLLVFCDEAAELPEIIFEILSPSTRHRDLRIKLVKYELMGVKEYWIVDPKSKTITIHDFINNTAEIYLINDIAKSLAQPEIQIALAEIFA